MSYTIVELAHVSHVRIMGVVDVDANHAVKVIYLDVPPPFTAQDSARGEGKLTGREAMALGHVLQELGAAMLGGDLRRDVNLGEGRP